MTRQETVESAIYTGWYDFQEQLIKAITPLSDNELTLSVAEHLRTANDMACHIIGARARWFYMLMGEGGDAFKELGGWDRPGAPIRSAAELVTGLETTWAGMHEAIDRWTAEQWADTWPGEDDSEPATITRQWVIWHLIEHDLYHGGEISLTLGAHGVPALEL